MSNLTITINGKTCTGNSGETILQIAQANGIYIPTLCEDPRVAHYGACGLCLVEGEGLPKLMRACSTVPADGWVLSTTSARVTAARKIALELLMSDHEGDCKGPCSLHCPAGTDCMAYVKEIARGNYHEAVRIVKEKFPLPASIGHVCPHPCEDACRRQYVEAPLSIAYLKRFAGLKDLEEDTWRPEIAAPTGKRVSVIGGGPAGLTAAYFLRTFGHEVTVYEQMPKMGGMLRYGIPAYRLPKEVIDAEAKEIEDLGVTFRNGVKIGTDLSYEEIKQNADATILAVGAWTSSRIGCKGEDARGVLGGIDFLRGVIEGKPEEIGKRVAVIGGGNTAMDACRSAIRLGAETVYIIYRRTRDEMPAEEFEIDEAMEEGVTFRFLTSPLEVLSENGRVTGLRVQHMELGEADESGRRKPVPVEGSTEVLAVDAVIAAIGQQVDAKGLSVGLTKRGGIAIDESAFTTTEDGVFAVGDAALGKPGIAIEAIGIARKAADVVNSYLHGDLIPYRAPYYAKRENIDRIKAELADRPKKARAAVPLRPAEERKNDFKDILIDLSEEEVQQEASRCLECGCHDFYDCSLIQCANCMEICPERFSGALHPSFTETKLETIERNQAKCVLCNLCVRTCNEVAGQGVLGLVGRGFSTVIRPEFNTKETLAYCKDCHKCFDVCPTGALRLLG